MSRNRSSPGGGGESLVVEIVTLLEEHGRPQESYHLDDYVDVDALDRLVDSTREPFSVSFTVDSVQVTVSEEGVSARRKE